MSGLQFWGLDFLVTHPLGSAQEKLRHSDSLLSDSEKCLDKLFHSTTLPLSINQIDSGTILDVNRAFERQSSHTKSELIGRSLNEVDTRSDAGATRELAEIRAGKATDRAVFVLTTPDRSEVVLHCTDRIQFEGFDCLLLAIRRSTR